MSIVQIIFDNAGASPEHMYLFTPSRQDTLDFCPSILVLLLVFNKQQFRGFATSMRQIFFRHSITCFSCLRATKLQVGMTSVQFD